MLRTYLLITIQTEVLNQRYKSVPSGWISDLYKYISSDALLFGQKIIDLGDESSASHLIFQRTLENNRINDSRFVKPPSANNLFLKSIMEAQFKWRAGSGFVCQRLRSQEKSSASPSGQDLHSQGYLIEKYMEFLIYFNSAYEDDICLNFSFQLAVA